MRHAALAAAILAVSAPNARAEIAECNFRELGNADYGNCLVEVLRRDDAALNRAYQAVLAGIDQETNFTAEQRAQWRDAIRRAQRAWVAFRDADCHDMIGWEYYGGTGLGPAELECRIERTRSRTADFRERYRLR